MENLKSKGIKAFIWDFMGKLSAQGMSFIVTIFLARLLEPSDFGLIAMVVVVIGIAQVFTDIGLGGALIQRRKVLHIHYSSVFYFNIFVASILTLLTFLAAENIASFYENKQLIPLIKAISVLFIINALSSVQATKLRKELYYGLLTKAGVVSSMAGGILGITLAFNDFGVWSLVGQTLFQGVCYNVCLWLFARWYPNAQFSFKALKQLWSFGFKMFLVEVLEAVSMRLDILIIGKLFAPFILGFYQRAKSLKLLVVQYSSGSLMSVMYPILSQVQNDLARFKVIVLTSLNILSLVVFLLTGVFYLSSEYLIVLLFSEKWLASVPYLEILLLSGFSYPLNALLVNILSSRGNSTAFLKMAIIKKIIFFSNMAIAFYWGITGYLYGLVLVAFINTSITIFFASKEINIAMGIMFKPIIIQSLISLISTSASLSLLYFWVFPLKTVEFLVGNTVFCFMYLSLNYLIKTDSWNCLSEQILPLMNKYLSKDDKRKISK